MNKFLIKRLFIITFLIAALTVLAPTVSNAVENAGQIQEKTRLINVQNRIDEIKKKREIRDTKLEEKRLLACQKKEESINNTIGRIGDRGSKQLDVFTKIYERVKTFYVEKGYILDNYDSLVSSVDAAKLSAEAAIAKTKEMPGTFKCSSEDPKGDSLVFKEYQGEQINTLKTYKTAIKDLIVGVKSTQSQTGEQL